jgi:hypothetical protein
VRGGLRKEYKRVNMVDTFYYVLIYINENMRPVESIPRMGAREIKENDGGSEFNFCKCHNGSPVQQ